jgi:BolA protein
LSIRENIEKKLVAAFSPQHLEVINESHLHAGHQDHFDGQGETHLRLRIVADAFSGMSRIERHRAINALVAQELADTVHAFAVEAFAPGEPRRW